MAENKFPAWMHKLTMLGYEKNIMISAEHEEIIMKYYNDGKTPEEALTAYTTRKPTIEEWMN